MLRAADFLGSDGGELGSDEADEIAAALRKLADDDMPARLMSVVEKHAAVIRLDLLSDLALALNLRLKVEPMEP